MTKITIAVQPTCGRPGTLTLEKVADALPGSTAVDARLAIPGRLHDEDFQVLLDDLISATVALAALYGRPITIHPESPRSPQHRIEWGPGFDGRVVPVGVT